MMMITIFLILISIVAIGLSIFLIFKLIEWDKKVVSATIETKQQISYIHNSFGETRETLKKISENTNSKVDEFKRGMAELLTKLASLALFVYIKKRLKK